MQVRVWDTKGLICLATLQGHSGAVRALAASPTRVFSGSDDTTIKVSVAAVAQLIAYMSCTGYAFQVIIIISSYLPGAIQDIQRLQLALRII